MCLFQGLKTFLGIGLGLEIGKSIFKYKSEFFKHPMQQLLTSIQNIDWNVMTFIVGYPVIYRVRSTDDRPYRNMWKFNSYFTKILVD